MNASIRWLSVAATLLITSGGAIASGREPELIGSVADSLQGLSDKHRSKAEIANPQATKQVSESLQNEQKKAEADRLFNEALEFWRRSQWQDALDLLEQALVLYREIGDRQGEAKTLNGFGKIADDFSQYSQALNYYQRALGIRREIGDRFGEGTTLNNIGVTYDNLGNYPQALDYYQQALGIRREIGDRAGEGTTLNNIGGTYDSLGDYPQALDYYEQALGIRREVGDRAGEGTTLNNIGHTYDKLGDYPQALDYYEQALGIRREVGDRAGEGTTLNNIGHTYDKLGDYPQALDHYEQALGIIREIGDRATEGTTLNNIGHTYDSLGDYPQALDHHEQALGISREIGDRAGEGVTLNNIGHTYDKLGDYPQALDYYEQALGIIREIGDRATEGVTLNNIGSTYDKLGDYPQALDYYEQALGIRREVGDRAGEGTTLNNIGLTYRKLGDYPQALDYYEQALGISREIGDRAGEGITLNNIGWLLDQTEQPELAIIFLKQSVSTFEKIRQTNQKLNLEQQQSYTDTIASAYRKLADILLQENRILEAQAVLDLLRTQELDDYFQDVQRSANAPDLDYWKLEEDILDLYTTLLEAKDILATLRQKAQDAGLDALTPDEREQLDNLLAQERQLLSSFNEFIEYPQVKELLAKLRTETEGQTIELASLQSLQDNIANLPNAVLLYPLIFEDRLELILIPADAPPIRRSVEVSAADLNAAILDYRQILTTPPSARVGMPQPEPVAQQLYQSLIADLEDDLARLDTGDGPQTIVYSPDRALRYIPLSALHDGDQWLAERFVITHITVDSVSDLDTPSQSDHRILAAACAECNFTPVVNGTEYPFTALPYTQVEVETLAQQNPTATVLLNQEFSKEATETLLQIGGHSIVHLATHGAFVSDSPDDSFLLFGDEKVATLRDMGTWNLDGVDLVVLSACETGLGGPELGSGIEVLGLGYQLQRARAKAALASLWKVSDGGTQTLMDAFYTALNNGHGKAEALRRAQLALIRNESAVLEMGDRGLALEPTETGEPLAIFATNELQGDLNHPYYWAPFILIGNGL